MKCRVATIPPGLYGAPAMLPLRSATDPTWIDIAIERFDEVLVDHAHCEKKAAASAMALVSAYPDHDLLIKRMCRLAQEELRHFRQVYDRISARGLELGKDPGDPYVQELLKLVRTPWAERRMDRLLVSSLIEARSCERLALLGEHLPDEDDKRFYTALARAEAGHFTLFSELAAHYDDPDGVQKRLGELAEAEAEILARLPVVPRIH